MKICMIAEGCYPFITGGVSSWIQSMIKSFPEHEYIILAIAADRSYRGKYAYELPENVSAVYEVYLNDKDWSRKRRKIRLNKQEYTALRSIVLNTQTDWDTVYRMFQKDFSIDDLLMGKDFLDIATELYDKQYPEITFSDFLWTLRSIYLPLFIVLKTKLPKADVYHCVATGYSGILGCMGKSLYGGKLLVSEHGIYTREREEEIIKAAWVKGVYKNIWIRQFQKLSREAYNRCDFVTGLFAHARELQIELGCPPAKALVTPNGIDPSRFDNCKGKTEEDEQYFNIGAVLRIAPIKDVKTLIQAFYEAKKRNNRLKLWIMGPANDEQEYADECEAMVKNLDIKDVVFTGRINPVDYLGRMDCTILTSISEGQPLTILEGYAAHKPAIATDVGNCRGLIYGENDGIGPSGILTHIMNSQEIAAAMLYMARHPDETKEMGENGYKRLMKRYTLTKMHRRYEEIYKALQKEED